MKPKIAVIGTGRMGSALVRAFLQAGYDVHAWNRTQSKLEPLVAQGAQPTRTVADAVAAAEIVILNVLDYEISEELLRENGVAQGLRGKLLVQLTSGTPRQARDVANWARQRDIHYLDGAIMATPILIAQPASTILYSGERETFEKHKAVLRVLGGNTLFLGDDAGFASALDNALLVVVWGTMFGALQGAAISEAEKLPLEVYLNGLEGIMPALKEFVFDLGKRIQERRFAGDETSQATVETCHASVRYLQALASEHGIRRAILDGYDEIFQEAVKAGRNHEDFSALHEFMLRANGSPRRETSNRI
jgi:3-hydroxyisobutyrate dehydrogenase-like beta-hydroxyacid dehydrogenase